MKSNWTSGRMDPERKKEVRQSFISAIAMRKRLLELLEKKMYASWAESLGEEGFETPNWALKQAYARGYEKALKEVASLVKD